MNNTRILLLVEFLAAQGRAFDEGHIVPRGRECGAKIVADFAGANDDDFHNEYV